MGGLGVRHSCAAQLGDRDAGWREAEAGGAEAAPAIEGYLLNTEIGELLRDYGFLGELGDDDLTVAIHKKPPRVTRTVL